MAGNSKTPFFMVTGFLGSGKTTLLKRFLQTFADEQRIGVIQNEFAAGNVDGVELRLTGKSFELLEINKGSVFCVCLLADFTSSLTDFVKSEKPDIVILEATGLADPIAIGEMMDAPELRSSLYLAHIWCVVDASQFMKMESAMPRMQHQVRVADTVIINKTDLAEASDALLERIIALNPFADIQTSSYCDLIFDEQLADHASQALQIKQEQGSENRPDIESKVIRTTRAFSSEQLERILTELATKLYRIKGFVKLEDGSVVAVQSSFGRSHVTPVERYSGPSELILMGPGLEELYGANRHLFR